MRKSKVVDGRQQYACGYCYDDVDLWDGLQVVTVLAPVVDGVRGCQRRQASVVFRCQYYTECQDTIARGGAALCERVFVLDARGQRVML